MTLQEYLTGEGLTAEEIAAIVGNDRQAKAMTKALGLADEGRNALTAAQAAKKETEDYWAEKTQQLEGSVTRLTAAEKRAAVAEAKAAERTAYLKSLADQGYDVPKEMYEGAAPVVKDPTTGQFLTRDDAQKMVRGTAPDLVSLTALSNEYYDLFGAPYVAVEQDFAEAQKQGKPLREFARSKYNFDGKRQEKNSAAEKTRIDALVAEQVKTKEAELVAKYGSNSNTSAPMPSRFDRIEKQPGFKEDSWKSPEGRAANRTARLQKFENFPKSVN